MKTSITESSAFQTQPMNDLSSMINLGSSRVLRQPYNPAFGYIPQPNSQVAMFQQMGQLMQYMIQGFMQMFSQLMNRMQSLVGQSGNNPVYHPLSGDVSSTGTASSTGATGGSPEAVTSNTTQKAPSWVNDSKGWLDSFDGALKGIGSFLKKLPKTLENLGKIGLELTSIFTKKIPGLSFLNKAGKFLKKLF